MDCGQADVLVAATIAGYEVRVEQLVVVFGAAIVRVAETDFGVAVGDLSDRNGGMGDVVKEGVTGADREMVDLRKRVRVACVVRKNLNQGQRGGWCARSHRRRVPSHDDLREALTGPGIGIGDEVPVKIGREQRKVADMVVGQIDAEDRFRLKLHLGPGGQPAVGAVEQRARCMWLAVRPNRVLAQEHLVRRMRGVGLVLIDEGSRQVLRLDVVGAFVDV